MLIQSKFHQNRSSLLSVKELQTFIPTDLNLNKSKVTNPTGNTIQLLFIILLIQLLLLQ